MQVGEFFHEKLLTTAGTEWFQKLIWDYYCANKRDFAWRQTHDPYHIVVSEIMLQQTQTSRVAEKYAQFIAALPTFEALAHASQREVLTLWSGLGYNRRGLALQKIAQRVVQEFNGQLPADPAILQTFSGIGPNTAGSICAFAFNMPVVFIETNIRAVYIHTFFKDRTDKVHDKELLPLIAQTVDPLQAREWYYALMDYGVMLKKAHKNPSRKSASHARQSTFEGSERQIRGMIIKLLTQFAALSFEQLAEHIKKESRRIERNLEDLCAEGLVHRREAGHEEIYFL